MGAIPPVPVGPSTISFASKPSARLLRLGGLVGLSVLAAWAPGRSSWAEQTPLILANWLVTVAFAVTAVLLAEETYQRDNARLFAGIAVFWTTGLFYGVQPIGPYLTWFCTPLVFPFTAMVLLRYPESHPHRRIEKAFIAASVAWLIGSHLLWQTVTKPAWLGFPAYSWWPTLYPDSGASTVAGAVYDVGSLALIAAFFVLVVQRLHRTRTVDRRTLAPVAAASIALGVVVTIDVAARLVPLSQPATDQIFTIEAVVMFLIPAAFLVATIRGRLARAGVADLVLSLARHTTVEAVRDGLRRALCDPSLDILYWVAETREYVDSGGHEKDPFAIRGRLVVPVQTADHHPLAVIVADLSLQQHHSLLDAAVTAGTMALENAQLQASVRAQMEQLRASRSRIVEAALSARRRVERDLHDGAQQRLLALKLYLASAQNQITDSSALAAIEHARAELRQTLQELRELASGIHPAVLTQAGLAAALEGVAERFPLPIEVDAPKSRCNPDAEATAYFLVCEALANIVKHAGATRARVRVERAGADLKVKVTDDGCGGAAFRADGGLVGMRDRVAALAGEITVTSPIAGGTEVEARIPCE
jgi:signal transduction histidine kinase